MSDLAEQRVYDGHTGLSRVRRLSTLPVVAKRPRYVPQLRSLLPEDTSYVEEPSAVAARRADPHSLRTETMRHARPPLDAQQLFARIERGVFLLRVTHRRQYIEQPQRQGATVRRTGTAFVFDVLPNGRALVFTCAHVTANATHIEATQPRHRSQRTEHVRVVATYPDVDMSLLEIDLAGMDGVEPLSLQAHDAPLTSGTHIYTVGYPTLPCPIGQPGNCSTLVHADGQLTSVLYTHLVCDLFAEHGLSGGPLCTADGVVVGLVSAGMKENKRVIYASPIQWWYRRAAAWQHAIEQRPADKKTLLIRPVSFGAQLQSATSSAVVEDACSACDDGVRVQSVVVGGPSERAGIRAGDLITAIDGRPVRSPGQVYLGSVADRADGTGMTGRVDATNTTGEWVTIAHYCYGLEYHTHVRVTVWRAQTESHVDVELLPDTLFFAYPKLYPDHLPLRFIKEGRFVFTPMGYEHWSAQGAHGAHIAHNTSSQLPYEPAVLLTRASDEAAPVLDVPTGREDPASTSTTSKTWTIIESVNGQRVQTLDDVQRALTGGGGGGQSIQRIATKDGKLWIGK